MKKNQVNSTSTLMDLEDVSHNFMQVEDQKHQISSVLFAQLDRQVEEEAEGAFDAEDEKRLMEILQFKKRKNKFLLAKAPKAKKEKNVAPENPDLKKGHWMLIESKRYHWFLEIYNQHFLQKHLRRLDKIFKTMAVFIGTREAEQCRSHHQKMEKKYHTFYKIIGNLRRLYYGTLDPAPLIKELKETGLTELTTIVDAEQIENEPKTKDFSSDNHDDDDHGDIVAKVQDSEDQYQEYLQLKGCFLGEEYEERLNLNFN